MGFQPEMEVGQELLNVPFPEMVEKLALAIANGQTKLDMNSSRVAKFMSDTKVELPKIDPDASGTNEFSLISLGFFPGFYRFTEAEIEVKMSITMARTKEVGGSLEVGGGIGAFSASVNASYSNKFNFSQEGASTLKVKMAPAPPPTLLETYFNAMVEARQAALQDALPAPDEG